jgi:hypothetical protein
MAAALGRILDKWQAQEMVSKGLEETESAPEAPDAEATVVFTPKDAAGAEPTVDTPQQKEAPPTMPPGPSPPADDWSDDIEETVVLSSPDAAPPDPATWSNPHDVPETQSQWEDDIEETVVLKGGGLPPVPEEESSPGVADQTVMISPASAAPPPQSTDPDADLAATMIQGSADKAPTPKPPDEDMEASVVIGATPSPPIIPDDDLEATIVQGSSVSPTPETPRYDLSREMPSQQGMDTSDLEATVVINSTGRTGSRVLPQENGEDEDLEATLIETPRPADQPPSMSPGPPQPPREAGPPKYGPISEPGAPNNPDEDDDIMEQTIIIRSDTKKE